MHLFISLMLADLTHIFFIEKYFLNNSDYEFMKENRPMRLFAHGISFAIFFYMLS